MSRFLLYAQMVLVVCTLVAIVAAGSYAVYSDFFKRLPVLVDGVVAFITGCIVVILGGWLAVLMRLIRG